MKKELNKVVEIARYTERLSQELCEALALSLKDSERIVVLYCGLSQGLAKHLATLLKLAIPSKNIFISSGDYAYNTLLPYITDEIDSIVLFSSYGYESCLIRVINALNLYGLKIFAITPKLPAEYRRLLRVENIIEIPREIYRTSVLHTNIRLAVKIGASARVERLSRELELSSVIEDLISRYDRELEHLYSREVTVVYAPSMEAVAEELIERSIEVYSLELARNIKQHGKLVTVYTSTEDHIVNEVILKLVSRGFKSENIVRFRLNTDPLTAPLYALLALSPGFLNENSG